MYDYIILGGGAAGLCCAMEFCQSDKSILLIEKDQKDSNDRTWSFWEQGVGKFDEIVCKEWNKINFYADIAKENVALDGYKYKMIRSADFYRYAHDKIAKNSNIHVLKETVTQLNEMEEHVIVSTNSSKFSGKKVLDSALRPVIDKDKHMYVAQHFGGWFVEMDNPIFQPNTATLMDFRIDQKGDTRFFYVLPFDEKSALIEIAIFSNDILEMSDYDKEIESYIKTYLGETSYTIKEKELGVIPMTSYPFHKNSTEKIIKIGTPGGWVKPSSGYAFKRITERSEKLVSQLISNSVIDVDSHFKYRWMDKVMLKAIEKDYVSGKKVFNSLFSKRKAAEVFQFLDEENSFIQDLKLMYSAPIIPFTRAALF